MTVLAERRRSAAAPWSRRLAGFAFMLFVLSGLGHRYGMVDTVSFMWLLGIVGGLALAGLVAAAAAFVGLWERGDKGGREAAAGALIALVVLVPFAVSAWRMFTYPPLVDISTDLLQRPSLALAAADRSGIESPLGPGTAETARLQVENYPHVTGRRYDAAPDVVGNAVLALLERRGWPLKQEVAVPAVGDLTIEATAYSYFLGFPSDVSIRLHDEGQSTYVDMRSASRYGRHDLGDNARRIASFLADLDRSVTAPLGETTE